MFANFGPISNKFGPTCAHTRFSSEFSHLQFWGAIRKRPSARLAQRGLRLVFERVGNGVEQARVVRIDDPAHDLPLCGRRLAAEPLATITRADCDARARGGLRRARVASGLRRARARQRKARAWSGRAAALDGSSAIAECSNFRSPSSIQTPWAPSRFHSRV